MLWKLASIAMILVGTSAFVAPLPAQQPASSDTQTLFTVTTPTQPPQPPPPPPIVTTVNSNGFYQVRPSVSPDFVARWNTAPEEANLAHEAEQLARQLGEAKSDTDRDKLKTKLGEVLEKQFDQRQKRHEREIESLEAQVKKLRDLVAKRQENRREIIGRRVEQILRESQGLGW
jgi:hypothetical protein